MRKLANDLREEIVEAVAPGWTENDRMQWKMDLSKMFVQIGVDVPKGMDRVLNNVLVYQVPREEMEKRLKKWKSSVKAKETATQKKNMEALKKVFMDFASDIEGGRVELGPSKTAVDPKFAVDALTAFIGGM